MGLCLWYGFRGRHHFSQTLKIFFSQAWKLFLKIPLPGLIREHLLQLTGAGRLFESLEYRSEKRFSHFVCCFYPRCSSSAKSKRARWNCYKTTFHYVWPATDCYYSPSKIDLDRFENLDCLLEYGKNLCPSGKLNYYDTAKVDLIVFVSAKQAF